MPLWCPDHMGPCEHLGPCCVMSKIRSLCTDPVYWQGQHPSGTPPPVQDNEHATLSNVLAAALHMWPSGCLLM